MRNTTGSEASTAARERVILMKVDSSSQAYMRSCKFKIMVLPMRENIPAIYGEEGGRLNDI